MEQEGIVIKTQGQTATVSVRRRSGCGEHCVHCGACEHSSETLEAFCTIDVQKGDRVRVRSESAPILFGMIALFVFPILLPLVGYVAMTQLFSAAIGGVTAAVLLIGCAGLAVFLNRSPKYLRQTKPCVVAKIDNTCNSGRVDI